VSVSERVGKTEVSRIERFAKFAEIVPSAGLKDVGSVSDLEFAKSKRHEAALLRQISDACVL
jgi:hypothetical protein